MNQHMIKACLIASGLALAVSLPLYAAAPMHGPEDDCNGPPRMMGKHGAFDAEHLPPYLKELNLSDEQRTKIGEIFKTQGPGLREQFKAGRNTREALRKLSLSSEYTEERAKALSEEGAKLMAEVAQTHARINHAIYEVLTPEQQQQLKEKMANFTKRGRHAPKP